MQPFSTALMDINVSLPTDCSYKFGFSKPFKPHKLEEVSAFVNGIYSKCMSEGVDHSSTIKFNDEAIEVKLALSSSILSPIPSRCEFVFEYLEENFNARLDDAASFVSEIYSKFPTLSEDEKIKLKESRLGFYKREANVAEVEVNEFKKLLKERIVQDINDRRLSSVSTSHTPIEMLKAVAQSVFKNCPDLGGLFPIKTQTWIDLSNNAITVYLGLDR